MRIVLLLLSAILGVAGCHAAAEGEQARPLDRGGMLANAYCGACHPVPNPDLLTKSNWVHGALRQMAPFLGVSRVNLDRRPDGALLKEANVFPTAPLVSRPDWEAIVDFYAKSAPTEAAPAPRIESVTELFSTRPWLKSSDAPCTTLLQFDRKTGNVFVGDAQTRTLKLVNGSGTVLREWETDSGPVSLSRYGSNLVVTLVGRILPSDELAGQIWQLTEAREPRTPLKLRGGLRRPVHTAVGDLDGDGREDLVTSCFGNRLGRLSWFVAQEKGGFREVALAEAAGIVRSLPYDWNGDGRPDLTVLRAQGREGADIYLNQGGGEFQRMVLWEDPASFGNAYFDLVDFDRDGRPELLVVNGDNGDFNCAPKPYHGVRIFAINGELRAELRFRFGLFGAYGARAADFDLDGDLDMAVVSFFPDYERVPDQSFVYLRNEGGWKFTPQLVPGLNRGRWIMIEAGDLDADGDADLLLGSFIRGPLTVPIPETLRRGWESDRLAVLLLENKTRTAESKR